MLRLFFPFEGIKIIASVTHIAQANTCLLIDLKTLTYIMRQVRRNASVATPLLTSVSMTMKNLSVHSLASTLSFPFVRFRNLAD